MHALVPPKRGLTELLCGVPLLSAYLHLWRSAICHLSVAKQSRCAALLCWAACVISHLTNGGTHQSKGSLPMPWVLPRDGLKHGSCGAPICRQCCDSFDCFHYFKQPRLARRYDCLIASTITRFIQDDEPCKSQRNQLPFGAVYRASLLHWRSLAHGKESTSNKGCNYC
jgi:hypothetical protein